MIEEIAQAQKSIYLEMYIFLSDTEQSHNFIGALIEKAVSGVRVVIVVDAYGSKMLKKETINSLKASGVEFIFFSNWLRHIHRKVLIIDKKIAFIGGVNIGKRFAHWNDLQIKLHGRIIRSLLRSFAYTYEMAGGKDPKILRYRDGKLRTKLKFWLIEHLPRKNIYALKSHYVEKITHAQKKIQITTPYFTPPRWLISLLDDAIRKGVLVEILIPQETDVHFVDRVNYRYMYNLHHLGIKFYLSQTMIHAKLLLIDGEEGLIGSQNIDHASFLINSEIGIFFKDKKLLRELSDVIDVWKQDSAPFEPKRFKMHGLDYVILALMKLFRPIL